jgi:uncharacterized protein YndB with AHSA1/START domain
MEILEEVMDKQSAVHSTFVIERSFSATPERVFDAFANPQTKRRWFYESRHHDLEHHELDFKVGGTERARLRFGPGVPVAGLTCESDTFYEDIVPGRRIVAADRMKIGGNFVSAGLVTIEILASEKGTDLILTHQGAYVEGSGGPEMRKGGWIALIDRLGEELAG